MNKIDLKMIIMGYVNASYPGHSVVVFLDAVVSLLQTGGLKWGLTHQQSVPERMQTVSMTISQLSHVQYVSFVFLPKHNCFSGVCVCVFRLTIYTQATRRPPRSCGLSCRALQVQCSSAFHTRSSSSRHQTRF